MEQMNFWDKPVQPKQTTQQTKQVVDQPTPDAMSTDEMVNKPVTANSSANHIATRLNLAYEHSIVAYKRLVDMKQHQEWTDQRHNDLEARVKSIESNVREILDNVAIIKEGFDVLMNSEVVDEQLSSPITEARIHGEID
jgi:hypothetical protein